MREEAVPIVLTYLSESVDQDEMKWRQCGYRLYSGRDANVRFRN